MKTKHAHTPGPWNLSKCGRGTGLNYTEFRVKADLSWRKHNSTEETVAKAWNESNARLIAAAPEMLEALERLVNLVERCPLELPPEDWTNLGHAKRVLAKARGES